MTIAIKKISVIGLGYIGLPTAAILASRGVDVIGVDSNPHVVATINEGLGLIKEPMLDIAIQSVVTTGRLKAVTHPQPAQAFLMAVPTPLNKDRTADTSYIRAAAESLAPVLEAGNLVVDHKMFEEIPPEALAAKAVIDTRGIWE